MILHQVLNREENAKRLLPSYSNRVILEALCDFHDVREHVLAFIVCCLAFCARTIELHLRCRQCDITRHLRHRLIKKKDKQVMRMTTEKKNKREKERKRKTDKERERERERKKEGKR